MRIDRRSVFPSVLLAAAAVLGPSDALSKPKNPRRDGSDVKPPRITHVRQTHAPLGAPIAIRARIDDESEIFAPSVYVRPRGKEEFDTIPMRRVEDGYEALIPAEQVVSDLEYFIEAFDEEGNGPAREGSPERPIRIAVLARGGLPHSAEDPARAPEDGAEGALAVVTANGASSGRAREDGGLLTRWWFWTIVGLAAAGGIAAGAVSLGGSPRAFVDIEVRGPDPAGGI